MQREQRWYEVTFVTLSRNPITRKVKVQSYDSVHAAALVYQQFGGRKKIKVKSAKVDKEKA